MTQQQIHSIAVAASELDRDREEEAADGERRFWLEVRRAVDRQQRERQRFAESQAAAKRAGRGRAGLVLIEKES